MSLSLRFLALRECDPDGYHLHPEAKFFKRVRKAMTKALIDPESKQYFLGDVLKKQRVGKKTLGSGYGHWRRIKNDMPDRYRLFFQFSSEEREVIFAWLNDERTLRREGSHSDVYAAFARVLNNKEIANCYADLRAKAQPSPALS